ncbi:hypothetical protein [Allosphingosinicella indica]|uniref:hypothetical protein n=1 Tax=Allosphingosinicella indica TaxID=941907 RepID=UPI0012F524B6|nr:hypothetical protein [Allosphingosinicella indica]
MNYFQHERLTERGIAHDAIDAIFREASIALDEEGKCQQEWLDCAAGKFPLALSDWINDKLVERKIVLFADNVPSKFREFQRLGIPKKDHKWVTLSIASQSRALVTEDIDLIEPRQKSAPAKVKSRIKSTCKGTVSRCLRRDYGVNVVCCEHVPDLCG